MSYKDHEWGNCPEFWKMHDINERAHALAGFAMCEADNEWKVLNAVSEFIDAQRSHILRAVGA